VHHRRLRPPRSQQSRKPILEHVIWTCRPSRQVPRAIQLERSPRFHDKKKGRCATRDGPASRSESDTYCVPGPRQSCPGLSRRRPCSGRGRKKRHVSDRVVAAAVVVCAAVESPGRPANQPVTPDRRLGKPSPAVGSQSLAAGVGGDEGEATAAIDATGHRHGFRDRPSAVKRCGSCCSPENRRCEIHECRAGRMSSRPAVRSLCRR
jgi:hypothetical protein